MTRVVNLCRNAACTRKVNSWAASASTTASQGTDGLWTYSCEDESKQFAVFAWQGETAVERVGYVFYARLQPFEAFLYMENFTVLDSGKDWCAGVMREEGNKSLYIRPGKSVKLLETGVYTREDWERVKALRDAGVLDTPWFSAGLMPLTR